MTGPAVAPLLQLPGVAEAVETARDACDRVRRHPAMRRQQAQCRIEADVWAGWASARLAGVDLPVELARKAAAGGALPPDAVGRLLGGALRAGSEAGQLAEAAAAGLKALPRALARLHLAAAAGLETDEELGRPMAPDPSAAGRLDALAGLVGSGAPALVVAALTDAEVSSLGLFRSSNDVVARAAARGLQIGLGLDPSGTVVTEMGALRDPARRVESLAAYQSGRVDGVQRWLLDWAGWVVLGAEHGYRVADSVLAGRPLSV